jgi:hypothetical protein
MRVGLIDVLDVSSIVHLKINYFLYFSNIFSSNLSADARRGEGRGAPVTVEGLLRA